jgi:predicted GNAT superfamily acetyltransferase
MPITIRPITDLTGCADLQTVHNVIWGNSEDEIIPTHVLITWQHQQLCVVGSL